MMSLLKAAFCAAEPSQRHRRRRWRLLTLITRTAGLCRSTNALTAARGVPYGSSRCRGEEEGAAATPAAATVRVSVPSFSAAGTFALSRKVCSRNLIFIEFQRIGSKSASCVRVRVRVRVRVS